VYYNEIDAGNLGISGTRSSYSHEAKAAFNWRAGTNDTVQVNLNTTGRRPTPQGYVRGSSEMNLGYRHRIKPNFSVTATVSDVFKRRRYEEVFDTATLSNTSSVRMPGRIFHVGVSWTLRGAKDRAQEKFEYD
jgi:hypothetical protein